MTDERKIATLRLYKRTNGPLTHHRQQSSWNVRGAVEKPEEEDTYSCIENGRLYKPNCRATTTASSFGYETRKQQKQEVMKQSEFRNNHNRS